MPGVESHRLIPPIASRGVAAAGDGEHDSSMAVQPDINVGPSKGRRSVNAPRHFTHVPPNSTDAGRPHCLVRRRFMPPTLADMIISTSVVACHLRPLVRMLPARRRRHRAARKTPRSPRRHHHQRRPNPTLRGVCKARALPAIAATLNRRHCKARSLVSAGRSPAIFCGSLYGLMHQFLDRRTLVIKFDSHPSDWTFA
jgi:hypothetical protein